jgi:ribonucleoside-triphosphate reductase
MNVPQAAYLANHDGNKTIEGVIEKVYESMEMAMDAHLRKKESVAKMMKQGGPLWQMGKPSQDGKPYVDLEKSTYIIGIIGVNDAVKYVTGQEIHESEEAMNAALTIVAAMNKKTQEFSEKHGLKVTLEETPAESAARRLAKTDMQYFTEDAKGVVKGSIEDDTVYYTNSVHLAAEADVGIVERIKAQGKFHGLIESGAITHAFVGEERPSAESIYQLVKNTFYKTQTAQVTISPEFTYCGDCHHEDRGILEKCPSCDSENVTGVTRVVGYYSPIQHWNRSKLGELRARQRGNYKLGSSPVPVMSPEAEPACAESTCTLQ